MGKFVDLTGQKFNKLTFVGIVGKSAKNAYIWECKCDCGNTLHTEAARVKNGNTKSCGCTKKDILEKRNTTHAASKYPEYSHWKEVKKRCYNENHKSYCNYGGRGIVMHDDFKTDFLAFLEEIGRKPEGRFSVGRIDNSIGYTYGNMRWETDVQQARNHSKQVNNTTGVTGIKIHTTTISGKEYKAYVGFYTDANGKKHTRSFSMNKYGEDDAFNLALKFREDGISKMKDSEEFRYAESHGKEK